LSDLRIATEVSAEADRFGDAIVRRRWIFSNLSKRTLDLRDFRMFVDVTSRDVSILSSVDASGNELPSRTNGTEGMKTRLECDFDMELAERQTSHVEMKYRHPRYLVEMRNRRAWSLTEYFERLGPLEDVDFTQEDPQKIRFELRIADPRRRVLELLRNPLQKWSVDCNEQCAIADDGQFRILTFEYGLSATDSTPNFHILSSIQDRPVWAAGVTATGSIAGTAGIQHVLPFF
jgi:hypothetical protein